jgi:hypothetical protein
MRSRASRSAWLRVAVAPLALTLVANACAGSDAGDSPAAPISPEASVPPITEVTVAPEADADHLRRNSGPPAVPDLGDPAGWTDAGGARVLFTDVTDAAGVAARYDSALDVALVRDTAIMMGGVGAGDFDNDGDTDLFVLGGGDERDSLFVNDGSGVFIDATERAGLAEPHLGSGVAVADYDGDGDLDLYVTSQGTLDTGAVTGANRLYRNNGDMTFTDVAEEAGVATTSLEVPDGFGAAFGDIDLDGDLDLFVTGWQRDSLGNRMFRNDGDGTFTDVTEAIGIVDDGVRGFAPCLVDMSGDFYPELLVVGDFSTSQYYANLGGATFSEMHQRAGTGQELDGMGSAIGDVNNDGWIDWYATAIADVENSGRGVGNALYLNQGDHRYEEIAAEVGVADGGWGWGALMVDVNQDGWLDIIATNGWDLPAYVGNLTRTFINDGSGRFVEVAAEAGPLHNRHGLGIAQLDLEGDGDQDIAITASNDEFTLYRSELAGDATAWLRVFLDTSKSPGLAPNGIGAMVRATIGGVQYTRTIGGCANFNSTSELSAHFGLGDAEVIDELLVEWPNGDTTTLGAVGVNQTLTIAAP